MKFFDIESPLMKGLSKMADLMWLNILTVVCCIPVFTAGAAFTALNYMALKIVRNEECYITKGYFKSFKENFKQATIIWLMFLAVAFVLIEDMYITAQMETVRGDIIRIVTFSVGVLVLFTYTFVFPIQAKFDNPIKLTLKNALFISILQFPKTILMIVLYLIPYVLLYFTLAIFPMFILFGTSVPAYLSAKLYDPFFKKQEDQILENEKLNGGGEAQTGEAGDEPIFQDEPIFSDEPILGDGSKTE